MHWKLAWSCAKTQSSKSYSQKIHVIFTAGSLAITFQNKKVYVNHLRMENESGMFFFFNFVMLMP